MSVLFIIYLIGIIPCFIIGSFSDYAYFQRKFPTLADRDKKKDKMYAIILGITFAVSWPITLIMATVMGHFKYGLLNPFKD